MLKKFQKQESQRIQQIANSFCYQKQFLNQSFFIPVKVFISIVVLLILLSPPLVTAATFVVNSTSNESEFSGTIGDGECLTFSGVCTFLAAVVEAEQTPALDTIDLTGVSGTIEVSSISFQHPLHIIGGGDVIISGINENFRFYGDGSVISGIEFAEFRNLILQADNQSFTGNVIRDGSGIQSVGDGNLIEGNRIYRSNSFGAISVAPYAPLDPNIQNTGTVIRKNIIGYDKSGSAAPGYSSTGITVIRATVLIDDNTSHGFRAGFYLQQVSDSSIINNRIGDYDGATGNGAISISGVAGHGIWSIDGTNNLYTGNSSNGHNVNGIYLEGSQGAQVLSNQLMNNGNAGIATTLPGSTVERNMLVGNAGLAIDVMSDGIINQVSPDGIPNPPTISVENLNGAQLFKAEFNDSEFANTELTYCLSVSTACPSDVSQAEFNLFCGSDISDNSGSNLFTTPGLNIIPEGRFITSTVTTPDGSSELSACSVVPPLEPEAEPLEFYSLNAWVLNLKSAKPLLGVFLGSGTNDVSTINIDSLQLGDAQGSVITTADVNEDGYFDMLVKFSGRETGASCGDTSLILNGEIAEVSFERELELRTVGCNPRGNVAKQN